MGETTGIAWTDSTWNPVRGCTKVSPGCKNCYAETFAERWRGVPGHAFEQGFDLRLVPEALEFPLRWRRPRRIFVNSMSDLFHGDVPDSFILRVFDVMREASHHTFQVLTKRPARMADFCRRLRFDAGSVFGPGPDRSGGLWLVGGAETGEVVRDAYQDREIPGYGFSMVMRNVWLGVSVENQAAADERIPHLLATPAAVRFLSCEPLLGPVDLRPTIDAWSGQVARAAVEGRPLRPLPPRIDWVIVGGESGPGARPCDVTWVRSLVQQCRAAAVPVFVKQLGAMPVMTSEVWRAAHPVPLIRPGAPEGMERIALQDRAGREPAEWPADLRVQQFPEVRHD
jgi:protein gp37